MVRLGLLAVLLFVSCSDFPIYKEKKKDFPKRLECIQVVSIYDKDIEIASKHLKISESCPYHLILKPHLIHQCHNPKVKSIGSDIDGYVRLELQYQDRILFRSQKDFKGDDYLQHMEELILDFSNMEEVKPITKETN